MFIVVKLVDCNVHIVIPESWVFDLNEIRLRNNGVNTNQVFLIYFNRSAYKGGVNKTMNQSVRPNWNLLARKGIQRQLNDTTTEAFFHARMVRFWGECFFWFLLPIYYIKIKEQ